jgi:hypothetical protein
MPRLPGVTRSRHGAARDKGCCAGRRPQAPCELGRSGVRSSPRRVARLEVPFQAVDECAGPGPRGGVGFTRGLSGLKRAFESPMLGDGERVRPDIWNLDPGCRSHCCWMPLTSWGDKDELYGQSVVPNGIPLSKIHHAAFDAHLIGIDPDGGRWRAAWFA